MRDSLKSFLVILLCVTLIVSIIPISFSQERVSPSQYPTISEYQNATGKKITKFDEAPMLAELVKQGKLPPVKKRLSEEPAVVIPVEEVGEYGGTWVITNNDGVLAEYGLPIGAHYVVPIYNQYWIKNRLSYGTSQYPWSAPGVREIDYTNCCPNAERALEDHLTLYLHEEWGEREILYTAETFRKVEKEYKI